MKEIFAAIAAILAVVGNVPYCIDIIKRRVKPHAYSWFVWAIVSGIVFFGQIEKGAGLGAIPTFAAEIFTFINFGLSLKYGYRQITRSDTYFLVLALAAIAIWIMTSDPTYSVLIAVIIDVIAFIPTIRKTWLEPKTESPTLYTMNVIRHVLALFSMQAYNIATVLHSAAMLITNFIMAALLMPSFRPKKSLL